MANSYQVSATEISENKTVVVRGKLGFSRLTKQIDGEELIKSDQRRAQNGMNPVGKPHTTATITDARVEFADPNNPTLEERFVDERRYASKKHPETGPNYSIDSKGNSLPIIGLRQDDGTYDQDNSGQELASGLDVSLVLTTYKPKNFAQHGLRLDQVLVNEPVKYYGAGGASSEALAARGVVFNTPPVAVRASEAQTNGQAPTFEDEDDTSVEKMNTAFPTPQPSAQSQAPVQPQVPQEKSLEEQIAELKAQNAALQQQPAAPQADSAVGPNPWNDAPQSAGITFQRD